MIGVLVHPDETEIVREFFELCKTPWEFHRDNHNYEITLSTLESGIGTGSKLILVFGEVGISGAGTSRDNISVHPAGTFLVYDQQQLPLYGPSVTFPESSIQLALEEKSRQSAVHVSRREGAAVIQIGYNIFREISHLLTSGQPAGQAGIATVELHIQLLRELITRSGIAFVEIPPAPADHDFIACLTHDIDHPLLRNHCGDHTMAGFLYRATLGALKDAAKSRISFDRMLRNWAAAAKLPLVYLGLARDRWSEFDRYVQIESGMGGTYFFIPARDNAGRHISGAAPSKRACKYMLEELKPQLEHITSAGNEVGLHGLNAWLDTAEGLQEKARITAVTGQTELGVRMHWLYFNESSPMRLDEAGFTYDSTVGYNQTIGFRAGTCQVYRPLHTKQLLELPLHVMDTALFYPDYLNLTESEAERRIADLLINFKRFGGVCTVNWHDRSIAPERLWDGFYVRFLAALKDKGAWFATASRTVAWFRQRRSAVIESVTVKSGALMVSVGLIKRDFTLPGLRVRVHRPHIFDAVELLSTGSYPGYVDAEFNQTVDLQIKL